MTKCPHCKVEVLNENHVETAWDKKTGKKTTTKRFYAICCKNQKEENKKKCINPYKE